MKKRRVQCSLPLGHMPRTEHLLQSVFNLRLLVYSGILVRQIEQLPISTLPEDYSLVNSADTGPGQAWLPKA